MTAAHRILNNSGERRIECGGEVFAEDDLCEALWLVNIELRRRLAKARTDRCQAPDRAVRSASLRSAERGGLEPPLTANLPPFQALPVFVVIRSRRGLAFRVAPHPA